VAADSFGACQEAGCFDICDRPSYNILYIAHSCCQLISRIASNVRHPFLCPNLTHWLKRHSVQNIVIGGAAGAIPPLVGWAAVTGDLSWGAWLLFGIIFLWTPPHFWALAMMIRDEYKEVGVPMLPVIEGDEETARQIWIYTLLMIPATLLLVYPLHLAGAVYAGTAIFLGAIFAQKAWLLLQTPRIRLLRDRSSNTLFCT